MDMIYTNIECREVGYLKQCEVDMELGSTISSNAKNDFTITMPIDMLPPEIEQGVLVYEVGSEFGGIVNGIGADTLQKKVTIYGVLWRGLLAQKIITPPDGQAYYQARGEANEAIGKLIKNKFDDILLNDTTYSGINITRDFRFVNLLEGIEKMLADQNARLNIRTEYVNGKIKAIVSAVHMRNYSNEIELSSDYGITLIAKKIKNGVNHVICLGKGELIDRTVIHLYKLDNGAVTNDPVQSIKGVQERTIIYDYSSAETDKDLVEGGKKKFIEKSDEENLSISIDTHVEIGDIVAARERITGIYMQKPITQMILKGQVNQVQIDYKVGE